MIHRIDEQVRSLLASMTLEEKIGQLRLVQSHEGHIPDSLRDSVRQGRLGGVLNEVDPGTIQELQRIAIEESRLGIPLLIGRDVIHGFHTVVPIPLGLAATWNLELVEACARAAAQEAASVGVNWTFGPGVDIGRDPRWGRIAETFGEDPLLISSMGRAMLQGFQGDDLSEAGSIAACAKHFAGYGAVEGGRDYNSTPLTERELRSTHLPPFEALVRDGVASIMPSFCDIDGIPATANAWLLETVLREEWGFDGLVISDWGAVSELSLHGLTADDRGAALEAARAGIDMEMASDAYDAHLRQLVAEGEVSEDRVDAMVANILRVKARLGLLDSRRDRMSVIQPPAEEVALERAQEAATQSLVLLKNELATLPLDAQHLRRLAVIGPLADDPYEQLGTWIFDGDPGRSQTPLQTLRERLGEGIEIRHARAVETTRSDGQEGFDEAIEEARGADVAVVFVGEESILSGEAHCRADLGLPGAQTELIRALAETDTPIVLVVMAGRPLVLTEILEHANAILYAWHPGSMAGPAIADVLFGLRSPSGKLPVTFPRAAGQLPIYYAHKNTGRPPTPDTVVHMRDIPPRAAQTSIGNTSFYLDVGDTPLFPFGYGLSYSAFEYANLRLSASEMAMGETLIVEVDLTNVGEREADEVAQLYVRDPVASVTRPVRELKGFQRVRLAPGETRTLRFTLHTDALAFVGRDMQWRTEPGQFHVWVGASSTAELGASFELVETV